MSIDDDGEEAQRALIEANKPDGGGVPSGAGLITLATLEELVEPGAIEAVCAAVNEQIEETTRRSTLAAPDTSRVGPQDYVDGSTMEECAARLPKMMAWSSEATDEEIAAAIVVQRSTPTT